MHHGLGKIVSLIVGVPGRISVTVRGVELCAEEREIVSREVARNGGRSAYRVISAQQRAERCRARPKSRKLVVNRRLHDSSKAPLDLTAIPLARQALSPQVKEHSLRSAAPPHPARVKVRANHSPPGRIVSSGHRLRTDDAPAA